jgi:hypothetical protein
LPTAAPSCTLRLVQTSPGFGRILAVTVALASAAASGAAAQLRFHPGVDVDITAPYVWRGITRVNGVSIHPALVVAVTPRAGFLRDYFFTGSVWTSIDLDRAPPSHVTDRGVDGYGIGEIRPSVEIGRPVGPWTISAGAVWYRYLGTDTVTGRTAALNSAEGYVSLRFDPALPVLLSAAAFRDWHRVHAWYLEGTAALPLRLSPTWAAGAGATVGRAEGQRTGATAYRRRPHFAEDGWTHVDFVLGLQLDLSPGLARNLHIGFPLSFAATFHLQRNLDPATRRTSADAGDQDSDWKPWGQLAFTIGGPVVRVP